MNRKYWLLAAIVCVFGAGTVAQAQTSAPSTTTVTTVVPDGVKIVKTGETSLLADAKGMTLYTYDPDKADASTCIAACAVSWPPLSASDKAKASGAYTIITREDGTKQWAYKGKPLYLWKNDKAPLDVTGDGVGGKWHVARP